MCWKWICPIEIRSYKKDCIKKTSKVGLGEYWNDGNWIRRVFSEKLIDAKVIYIDYKGTSQKFHLNLRLVIRIE